MSRVPGDRRRFMNDALWGHYEKRLIMDEGAIDRKLSARLRKAFRPSPYVAFTENMFGDNNRLYISNIGDLKPCRGIAFEAEINDCDIAQM